MLDLEAYAGKCADSGRRLIKRAYEEARSRNHNQLSPEHVLLGLFDIERPLFNQVMQSLNLDPQVVLQSVEAKLSQRGYLGRGVKTSEAMRTLLRNALKNARRHGRWAIESTDLFVALFKDRDSFSVALFKRLGSDPEMATTKIEARAASTEERPQVSG